MTCSVFIDSDVVIFSLLSDTGAAKLLVHHKEIMRYVTDVSLEELEKVTVRLQIPTEALRRVIREHFRVISLKKVQKTDEMKFSKYTQDRFDVHIITGAVRSKAKYLITYNTKHYHIDRIRQDLGIIVFTPAMLLQYLRSLQ